MRSTIWQVCVLFAGAAVLGCVLNALRPNPLPWRYVNPPVNPPPSVSTVGIEQPDIPSVIGLEELRKLPAMDVLIIDARPPLFFRRSRIPGAINIAKQYLPRDFSVAEPVLRNAGSRKLVIYCAHEECEDSQMVAEELSKLGFRHLFVFKGGWKAWKEAGLPEENG